jgi:hypothetical protein
MRSGLFGTSSKTGRGFLVLDAALARSTQADRFSFKT